MTPVTDPALIAQLESGSGSVVTDPVLLAQLNGNGAPASLAQQAMLPARAALLGLTHMGGNIIGDVGTGLNAIGMRGAGQYLQGAGQQATNVTPQQLGIQNPGIGTSLISGAAQYAPYALAAPEMGASEALSGIPYLGRMLSPLAQRAAQAGAAYGATQSAPGQALSGAAMGAGLNAGITGLGQAIPHAIANIPNSMASLLSGYASSGLAKSIGKALEDAKNSTNVQAYGMAQNNYANMGQDEDNAWTAAKTVASGIDAQGVPFDNQSYQSALTGKINQLTNKSRQQSGFARAYAQPINYLNQYAGDQTGTYTDAIAHNQALNQDLSSEINPNTNALKTNQELNAINFAKGNIKSTLNNNIDNNDLSNTLGAALNNANNLTSQKKQIFEQIGTQKGGTNQSIFGRLQNNPYSLSDPTTFVQDYLPKGAADGVQKMQQFAQMVGDPKTARNVLKANYFDSATTPAGINPDSFLKKYNNLSPDQQNFLFNPQEQNQLSALNKISAQQSGNLHTPFWYHTVPAILGGLVGRWMGAGLFEGGVAGYAAGKVGNYALNNAFENPSLSNFMVNRINNPGMVSSVPLGLQNAIRSGLQSTVTPQVIGSQ